MIEEQAVVVKLEGKYAWLETQRQSSCGHCSVKEGCGTQVLGKFMGNKMARMRCENLLNVSVGEKVVIGLDESAMLKGSLLLYLVPILSMIFFSGAAVMLSQLSQYDLSSFTDLIAVIAAFFGLLSGLIFSRFYVHRSNSNLPIEPVILKKVDVVVHKVEIMLET